MNLEVSNVKTKMTGEQVIQKLLALGDGDSVLIDDNEWTSFEEHGFAVEDLRDGGVQRVGRAEVECEFVATKYYEVVR
jgi:hypothetical protein